MASDQRVAGNGYRMVYRPNPAVEARQRQRQRLEDLQLVDRPIVLASRHNFNPPLSFSAPQGHDRILATAKQAMKTYSNSSFSGFCNPLNIEPLFSVNVVFLHQAMLADVAPSAMYAIGRYGLMAKVHLYLNPVNNSQVLVQDQQTFVDLKEWLKSLPSPTCNITGQRGYDLMLQWWTATNQVCSIMEVTAEVRIQILEHAFGYDIYPSQRYLRGGRQWGSVRKLSGGNAGKDGHGGTLKQVQPPTLAILTLNKKIYGELSQACPRTS